MVLSFLVVRLTYNGPFEGHQILPKELSDIQVSVFLHLHDIYTHTNLIKSPNKIQMSLTSNKKKNTTNEETIYIVY